MQCYHFTLQPLSAFASPLQGDTLFGQLCWAIRNRFGELHLEKLLQNYASKPFAVISDGFPAGFVPLPKLPGCFYETVKGLDRKAAKKRNWLPLNAINQPLPEWLSLALSEAQIAKSYGDKRQTRLIEEYQQTHNSINRQTATTGAEGFAPYSVRQYGYHTRIKLDCYLLIDEQQCSLEEITSCVEDIGQFGYGRDASIGMGKFLISNCQSTKLPQAEQANAGLSLAPCAPQGMGYDSQKSYYQTFTRFGRHGDRAVHQQGKPFKNPILMAQTGAVFHTGSLQSTIIGQAIGGDGILSKTIPTTVHQGYAPVIAIQLPENCRPL